MDTLLYGINYKGIIIYHLKDEMGMMYELNPLEIREDDEEGHLKYACALGPAWNGVGKDGRMYLI